MHAVHILCMHDDLLYYICKIVYKTETHCISLADPIIELQYTLSWRMNESSLNFDHISSFTQNFIKMLNEYTSFLR